MNTLIFDKITPSEVALSDSETALRLKTEKGYSDEQTNTCLKELKENCSMKYICTRVPVIRHGATLNLGFGDFKSKSLSKNLENCDEAFVFLVTLGFECDRLLKKLSLISPARAFICDALASSMAEAVCDKVEEKIKGDLSCRPRFSPGYGDLPLTLQPALLEMLNAQKLAGITINEAFLMSPEKTITCIMGIVK